MAFEQKEIRLHCAALKWLRLVCPDCLIWHTPNGGKRSKETARLMRDLGTMPGVFDLTLVAPDGRHFYLEAKSEEGRLSESQKWFKQELIKRGIPYVVFSCFEHIEAFLRQYHIPNRLAELPRKEAA
jgi:hypothetical protein